MSFVVVGSILTSWSDGARATPTGSGGFGPLAERNAQASALAVDGQGDLFVLDVSAGRVAELDDGGAGQGSQMTLPLAVTGQVTALAVDRAGDVFLAEGGGPAILGGPEPGPPLLEEYTRGPAGYGSPVVLATLPAGQVPSAMAIDGIGNLFTLGTNRAAVNELVDDAGRYGTPVAIPLSARSASGLAVDGAGDLFTFDSVDGGVAELPKIATGYAPVTVIPATSYGVGAVATNSKGDLFVGADVDGSTLEEIPRSGSTYAAAMPLSAPGFNPSSIAVDPAGNAYVNGALGVIAPGGVDELPMTTTGLGPASVVNLGGVDVGFFALSAAGMALDASGDLFVADNAPGGDDILELEATPTGYVKGPIIGLPNADLRPLVNGIAIDSAGDLFAATSAGVWEVPRSPSGFGPAVAVPVKLEDYPNAYPDMAQTVAVDGNGDVFVGYYDHGDTGRLTELTRTAQGYAAQIDLGYRSSDQPTLGLAVDGDGNVFASNGQYVEEIGRSAAAPSNRRRPSPPTSTGRKA